MRLVDNSEGLTDRVAMGSTKHAQFPWDCALQVPLVLGLGKLEEIRAFTWWQHKRGWLDNSLRKAVARRKWGWKR